MTVTDIYRMNARREEGFNRLAETADVIETTQEGWAEADMHRLWGTLLLSMQDDAAPEDAYRKALAGARQPSARFWEPGAAVSSI
jgi:hypothetical protein